MGLADLARVANNLKVEFNELVVETIAGTRFPKAVDQSTTTDLPCFGLKHDQMLTLRMCFFFKRLIFSDLFLSQIIHLMK